MTLKEMTSLSEPQFLHLHKGPHRRAEQHHSQHHRAAMRIQQENVCTAPPREPGLEKELRESANLVPYTSALLCCPLKSCFSTLMWTSQHLKICFEEDIERGLMTAKITQSGSGRVWTWSKFFRPSGLASFWVLGDSHVINWICGSWKSLGRENSRDVRLIWEMVWSSSIMFSSVKLHKCGPFDLNGIHLMWLKPFL